MNTLRYEYMMNKYILQESEYDTNKINYGQKFNLIILGQPYLIWHPNVGKIGSGIHQSSKGVQTLLTMVIGNVIGR
jgi:hypothetical protein